MNDYSRGYSVDSADGADSGRDRLRPAPGDPEAGFYAGSGERMRWVEADSRPDARSEYSPYGYARHTHVAQRGHNRWVKWLLIALAILFAIPLLKLLLVVIVVASAALALLIGLVVFLALVAIGGVLLFGAGSVLFGSRRSRL